MGIRSFDVHSGWLVLLVLAYALSINSIRNVSYASCLCGVAAVFPRKFTGVFRRKQKVAEQQHWTKMSPGAGQRIRRAAHVACLMVSAEQFKSAYFSKSSREPCGYFELSFVEISKIK